MNSEVITDGEANDFRARMREMDRRQAESEKAQGVHEARCTARYTTLLIAVSVSIAINLPSAWPHLMTILGIVK